MYRPPDSKVEPNDKFEHFIDVVSKEDKEFLLLVGFNKNLINDEIEIL